MESWSVWSWKDSHGIVECREYSTWNTPIFRHQSPFPRIPMCHDQPLASPDSRGRCPVWMTVPPHHPSIPSPPPCSLLLPRPWGSCCTSLEFPRGCWIHLQPPSCWISKPKVLLRPRSQTSGRPGGGKAFPSCSWKELPKLFGKSLGDKEVVHKVLDSVENTWMGQDEDLCVWVWVSGLFFWLDFLPQGLSRGRVFKGELSKPWEVFPLFPVFGFPLGIPGWIYRKHLDGTR